MTFKIQIAASKNPINNDKLKNIYCGNEEVREIVESGWYKYMIGSFSKYSEALSHKNSVNVIGAFVVAYRNSSKLSINEAIKLTEN